MKSQKVLLFVCLALLISVVRATNISANPMADESFPLQQEESGALLEPRHVRFGMTPGEVMTAMHGKPDVVLAPNLWVYWRFRAAVGRNQRKFDTLVVYFSQNRVTKFRLVERKAMQELIATLRKSGVAIPDIAAK